MSQNQTFNNVVYPIPVQGDTRWGPSLTRYLAALGTYAISPAGGAYTLTADLNLGANFGLLTKYYKSATANIAATGVLRLAHADSIGWRNNANSADLMFSVNSTDQLLFNGTAFFSGSLTNGHILVGSAGGIATDVALSGDVAITNAGVSSVNSVQAGVVTNAMVNNAAAIAYSKLSLTGSVQNADIVASAGISVNKLAALTVSRVVISDASGFLSASTVTPTTLAFLDATSSVQTQLNAKYGAGSTILFADGLVGTPGLGLNSETNSGLYKVGTGNVGAAVQGTQIFRFNANGLIINSGNIVFNSTSTNGIQGTTTNDSAAAGNVGERISSAVSAVSVGSTGTWADMGSIVFATGGDYDVYGLFNAQPNGGTVTLAEFGISVTSGNSSTGLVFGDNYVGAPVVSGSTNYTVAIPAFQRSLAAGTTVYLKAFLNFSVATPKFYGRLTARRVR